MIVRRYGAEYFVGGNIFTDFLSSIGIADMEDFVLRENRVNKSIGDNFAEIKRVLCMLSEEDRGYTSEISPFFEKIAVQCTEISNNLIEYSMYSQQELEQIWQRFQKSNEAVRKLYFPQEQELFIKYPVKNTKWTKQNSQMQEDIILFFGNIVLQQQQENEQLSKQLQDVLKQQNAGIQKLKGMILQQNARIQKQNGKLQQQNVRIQKQETDIRQLQQYYKQNKGELKIVIMILKPIKWIWWKMNNIKKNIFGKVKQNK